MQEHISLFQIDNALINHKKTSITLIFTNDFIIKIYLVVWYDHNNLWFEQNLKPYVFYGTLCKLKFLNPTTHSIDENI